MSTSHIIIESLPTDMHGLAVQWALANVGVNSALLHSEYFGNESQMSAQYAGDGAIEFQYRGPESRFRFNPAEPVTYWMRRRGTSTVAARLDEDDRKAAARENQTALTGLRQLLSIQPGTVFINDLQAVARAECKSVQLEFARQAGMRVPRTLFSNDRDAIVAFIESEGRPVIAKTYTPLAWRQPTDYGHRSAMAYSFLLDADRARTAATLQWCSGIYQQPLSKRAEARVTFFGDACFGTLLDSQSVPDAVVDWRAGQGQVAMQPFDVPTDIVNACRAYLRRSGLLMGCFDFVITEEGDWYFLECNEQGQWLWQEARCPDLHLLAAFVEFIQNPSATFHFQPSTTDVRADDYRQIQWRDDMRAITSRVQNHVPAHVHIERVRA